MFKIAALRNTEHDMAPVWDKAHFEFLLKRTFGSFCCLFINTTNRLLGPKNNSINTIGFQDYIKSSNQILMEYSKMLTLITKSVDYETSNLLNRLIERMIKLSTVLKKKYVIDRPDTPDVLSIDWDEGVRLLRSIENRGDLDNGSFSSEFTEPSKEISSSTEVGERKEERLMIQPKQNELVEKEIREEEIIDENMGYNELAAMVFKEVCSFVIKVVKKLQPIANHNERIRKFLQKDLIELIQEFRIFLSYFKSDNSEIAIRSFEELTILESDLRSKAYSHDQFRHTLVAMSKEFVFSYLKNNANLIAR